VEMRWEMVLAVGSRAGMARRGGRVVEGGLAAEGLIFFSASEEDDSAGEAV